MILYWHRRTTRTIFIMHSAKIWRALWQWNNVANTEPIYPIRRLHVYILSLLMLHVHSSAELYRECHRCQRSCAMPRLPLATHTHTAHTSNWEIDPSDLIQRYPLALMEIIPSRNAIYFSNSFRWLHFIFLALRTLSGVDCFTTTMRVYVCTGLRLYAH